MPALRLPGSGQRSACCPAHASASAHSAASPRSSASQRTLAVELQRLSIQFRKQQKGYLARLRSKDGGGGGGAGGSSFDLLGVEGQRQQEDYDPGFSDMQARACGSERRVPAAAARACLCCWQGGRRLGGCGGALLGPVRACRWRPPALRGAPSHSLAHALPVPGPPQAMKVDTLSAVIDERDREVQRIVASINELGQVGGCTTAGWVGGWVGVLVAGAEAGWDGVGWSAEGGVRAASRRGAAGGQGSPAAPRRHTSSPSTALTNHQLPSLQPAPPRRS